MCSKTGDFYTYYGFLSRFYSHIISCPLNRAQSLYNPILIMHHALAGACFNRSIASNPSSTSRRLPGVVRQWSSFNRSIASNPSSTYLN